MNPLVKAVFYIGLIIVLFNIGDVKHKNMPKNPFSNRMEMMYPSSKGRYRPSLTNIQNDTATYFIYSGYEKYDFTDSFRSQPNLVFNFQRALGEALDMSDSVRYYGDEVFGERYIYNKLGVQVKVRKVIKYKK